MPGEARWEPIIDADNAFVGWCDREVFEAWVERGAELMQGQAELDRRPFAEQRDRAKLLVEAASGAYRAVDVPAPTDPEYQRLYLAAGNQSEEPVEGEPPVGGDWLDAAARVAYQPTQAITLARAGLNWQSEANTDSLTISPAAWMAGWTDSTAVPTAGPRPVWDWTVGFTNHRCAVRSNVFGDCDWWENQFMPPALWEFWLWGAIMTRLVQRSPWAVVRDARDWAIVRNFRVMALHGIGGRDITRIIGAAEAEAEAARGATGLNKMGRAMAAGGAILLPLVPIGTVVGGIFEGVSLAIEAFGPAVGYLVDAWGRRVPAFTPWRISGGSGESDKPTHTLAMPPGFRRRPRGSLRVLLPRELPSARVRVDGNEPRAAIWDGTITTGPHFVEVSAEGRVPQGRTLTVAPDLRTDWVVAFERPEERSGPFVEETPREAARREASRTPRRGPKAEADAAGKAGEGSKAEADALPDNSGTGSSSSSTGSSSTDGSSTGSSTGSSSTGERLPVPGERPPPGMLSVEGEGLPREAVAGVWRVQAGASGAAPVVTEVRDFGAIPYRAGLAPGEYLVRWRIGDTDGEANVRVESLHVTTVSVRPPRRVGRTVAAVAAVVVVAAVAAVAAKRALSGSVSESN